MLAASLGVAKHWPARRVQMSMRNALDRLEGVTDPRELRSRLAQSHELGDSIQAKANFLSMYPGEVETWNQFMDAAEAHNDLERMGPGYAPDPPRRVNVAPEQGLAPLRAVE